jgi:hypothetical protein
MTRKALLALALIAFAAAAAPAQGWAEKMFPDGVNHDFGTVPRGALLVHRFTITNPYAVRMDITKIDPGCNCVEASAVKRTLEPRESTTLEVTMNAAKFTGAKAVVVRVTVGPDFVSTADVKVSAFSRADVVFNPGEAAFGAVPQGKPQEQTVDVEYAGALKWQVAEVTVGKDQPFEATATELYRNPGKVGYRVKVTLKGDAPAGAFQESIYLKTNDPTGALTPLLVTGDVRPQLTATPKALKVGAIKVGEKATKRVQIVGYKPFKVLGVDGMGAGVKLDGTPAEAAATQTLSFTCQFDKAGEFRQELKIRTDLQDEPVVVVVEGTAAP